jgi:hypothetical protein
LSSRLDLLASELDRSWPDAARSLREGMEETLTLTRLGISGQLAKTLASTNACESMIEIVRYTQRNVKSWQSGDMRLRWSAAGMLEAERQFRRIIGYRDLASSPSRSSGRSSESSRSPPPRRRRSPLHPSEIIHSGPSSRSSTTDGHPPATEVTRQPGTPVALLHVSR